MSSAEVPVEYRAFFRRDKGQVQYPHCDDLVLHAPGTCRYCDHYPAAQAWRVQHFVNFTAQHLPGLAPCFAERRRAHEIIHEWGGNRPVPTKP